MPINGFVDPSRVYALKQAALVANGFTMLTVDGDGNHVEAANWDAFNKAVDDIIVALPNVTNQTKNKLGRTFHSILIEVLPSLKVDGLDIDEEKAHRELITAVKRRANTSPHGTIQLRLADRVMCTGDLLTNNGYVDGVWMTASPSPTGPLAEAWEKRVIKWSKEIKGLTDFGRMTTSRVPKFSKHAIATLESHAAQVNAALEAFKMQALAAGAESDTAADDDADTGEE